MPFRLDIPGFMHEKDLQVIEDIAADIPEEGRVAEVGSWLGMSTYAWAASVKPSVTVYAIDLWEWMPQEYPAHHPGNPDLNGDPFEMFNENIEDCDNVVPLRRNSSGGEWEFGEMDVIFIDAMHRNPWIGEDIHYWEQYVRRPGGIICGDDYSDMFPDVRKEAELLARRNDKILETPGQKFWMVRF